MLIIPTSATTAIILEQPNGSVLWVLLGYLAVAAIFAAAYCGWEMVLSAASGHAPVSSRWLLLAGSAALLATGFALENLLLVDATFNGVLETYWGFVLSPWLFLAFIPCAVTLVAMRMADARTAKPVARVPALAWWCVGCLLVVAYGVALLWTEGRSATMDLLVMVAGFALVIAAVGSLASVLAIRWRRRVGAAV